MCGIAGLIQRLPNPQIRSRFIQLAHDALRPRGPDAQTFSVIDDRVTLIHTRLAIIDLEGGHQPMQDAEGAIVLNGEIYNYADLRHPADSYATSSDTEVLLKGLNRSGTAFLNDTDGMFAIGWFSLLHKTLTLARDRFGIKSVYYYVDENVFAFASTLTPLMLFSGKTINPRAFQEYYLYRAARTPHTLFADVHELGAGETLTFDLKSFTLSHQPRRWATLPQPERLIQDESEALDVLDQAMQLSIRRHLVSDVPVATFLSGGVDSSLVTGMAAQHVPNLAAFTVGFTDSRFDESPHAASLCRQHGLKHHVFYTNAETFLDFFERWPLIMDDAVADPSAVMLHRIALFARENGYKVLLSGEGADELFAGYNQQFRFLLASKIRPWGCALTPFAGWLRQHRPNRTRAIHYARQLSCDPRFYGSSMIFEPYLAPDLFNHPLVPFDTAETFREALLHDQRLRLPNDILTRTDRATMGASIEARVPFLTAYVQAAAHAVDPRILVRGRVQKALLKKYAERYVPHSCLYRPKVGFDMPLASWLRGPIKEMVMDALSSSWQHDFFRPGVLQQVVDDHMLGRSNNADKLFAFLLLEKNIAALRSIGKAELQQAEAAEPLAAV
jgi:asparagine synthase (glutamine-hydrolysing)